MTTEIEQIVDRSMDTEKLLRLPDRLEFPHSAFPYPG